MRKNSQSSDNAFVSATPFPILEAGTIMRTDDPCLVFAPRSLTRPEAVSPEKDGRMVEDLLKRLRSTDQTARLLAAVTLGSMGRRVQAGLPALVAALQDRDTQVRQVAVMAIAGIGPEAKVAIPALAEALRDEDAVVRSQAATTLGKMGVEARAAIPALWARRRDTNREVSKAIAWALGKIDPPGIEEDCGVSNRSGISKRCTSSQPSN